MLSLSQWHRILLIPFADLFNNVCSPVVYNGSYPLLSNGITTSDGDPDGWVDYVGRGAILCCHSSKLLAPHLSA